jgi:hypothetical protein
MASQWPSHPWGTPSKPAVRTRGACSHPRWLWPREHAKELGLLAHSRYGPSILLPWLVSGAAGVWLSRCRGFVRVRVTANVSWYGVNSHSR